MRAAWILVSVLSAAGQASADTPCGTVAAMGTSDRPAESCPSATSCDENAQSLACTEARLRGKHDATAKCQNLGSSCAPQESGVACTYRCREIGGSKICTASVVANINCNKCSFLPGSRPVGAAGFLGPALLCVLLAMRRRRSA